MKQKQPSIRIWVLSATVGVLSAAVMIAGAAQETARAAATEREEAREEGKVVVWCTCDEKSEQPKRPAAERVELSENEEQFAEDHENEKIEAALLDKASVLEDVKITFYCCEKRKHICGTGDGLTASGTEVTPYVTVAVDPKVIPLGSTVLVDFGDGVIHYFVAEDVGGAVKGNHIDIAVKGHQEALELGVKTATVWWIEE